MNCANGKHPRGRQVLSLILVLMMAPLLVGAGEFKPSRYIEPNWMTNALTRHVRNGLVKRIALTDAQLVQIKEIVDPHRDLLAKQLTEVKESRVALVEAMSTDPYDEKAVVAAHRQAAEYELGLTLTVGAILREARGILTLEQVLEVHEIVAEISEASDLRFLDIQEQLAAGELLVPTSRSSDR